MNPVKLVGGMLLVLGVCGMLLGSAMVPVSAPIWADEGVGGIGGGGGSCTSHTACVELVSPCTLNGSGCTAGGCDTSKQGCDGCECKDVNPSPEEIECKCSL